MLIPVDTAGRVIELAATLDEFWNADSFLRKATLVILHELAPGTFEFARIMIEWMSDEVVKRFDVSRDSIFDMNHVKLVQSLKQLEDISTPLVVLATSVSMEAGASSFLFSQWCSRPQNSVILVDRPEEASLYSTLYQYAASKKLDDSSTSPLELPLTMRRKEYPKGDDLEKWRENERARKAAEVEIKKKEEQEQAEKELLAKAKIAEQVLASDNVNVLDSTDNNHTTENPAASDESDHKIQTRKVDYDESVLEVMKRYDICPKRPDLGTFPFTLPPKPSWDEYGQVVDTACFMIGEDPGEGVVNNNVEIVEHPETMTDADLIREEVPAEYKEEQIAVTVNCDVTIADFTGLCDGDSLKRLMKEIEPRHVTVIAGSEEETNHFKEYLLSQVFKLPGKNNSRLQKVVASSVAAPRDMETVDITSHTSVCHFSLQDKLIESLSWESVSLSHIAFMDAIATSRLDDSGKNILAPVTSQHESANDAMEVDITAPTSPTSEEDICDTVAGHETVLIGTIMLNQLLDKLSQAGLKAEFAGGALCVQNPETGVVVLVKKASAQRIVLEGAFSEEYLKIRELLYKELIIPK